MGTENPAAAEQRARDKQATESELFLKKPATPVVANRGRDFDATARHLEKWLTGKIDGASAVRVADLRYPQGAGHSNETILFNAAWQDHGKDVAKPFVARLHPGEFQLFLDPAFERQFTLLELIHKKGWLRVPKVYWQEHDSDVLGRPFFVMEQVTGNVPVTFPNYNVSGFLADATPRERERAWLSAMDQFTAIHRIPVDEVRFLHRPQYGATGFEDEYEYWMQALVWTAGDNVPPACTAALEWLKKNRPAPAPESVSWGDARIGNMIFGADFQVAVVLDWEQATIAGALQDLGWWLLFDELFVKGLGIKRLEGLGNRQQTIDLWQERTGQRATDLEWYQVYAAFKTAILAMRGTRLKGQCTPANNSGNNIITRWICDFLGLPPPADML